MTTLTTTQARTKLYQLIDDVNESHHPVQIVGKRSSAILVSEEDWKDIQETIYLLSVPGMKEKLERGRRTPISKCAKKLNW